MLQVVYTKSAIYYDISFYTTELCSIRELIDELKVLFYILQFLYIYYHKYHVLYHKYCYVYCKCCSIFLKLCSFIYFNYPIAVLYSRSVSLIYYYFHSIYPNYSVEYMK